MRTLVVGDVHGCSAELRRLVDEVRPDALVLVGDLFTKGPDPVGVWELIKAHRARAVLGNHDQRLLEVLAGERRGDREGRRCVELLDAADPSWRDWLQALPLWIDVHGWIVVHAGLHPDAGTAGTTKGMAIAMRRFPEAEADAPRWHATYTGEAPVIFGHDAVGGLVWRTREGRPHLVGLDTGCVYGGVLSGLVLPDATLVQVPAEAAYAPVGRGAEG